MESQGILIRADLSQVETVSFYSLISMVEVALPLIIVTVKISRMIKTLKFVSVFFAFHQIVLQVIC
uniref:Uncharacterized protein n=1 Tax=Solanum lycopersicum TaxID=4081 RepID=A0A3Q7EWW1_SOLLC